MSFLRAALARTEQRQHSPWDDFWYTPIGAATASGARVSPELALSLSAVYCAVRIIAESVAQIPLILYRRLPNGGKERATDHPLFSLIHRQPNSEQTTFEWREMLQGHVGLRGNAFSQIVRRGNGEVVALVPWNPTGVRYERASSSSPLTYYYRPRGAEERAYRADQVLHIRGLSSDGMTGLSPISLARETIGQMLSTLGFGSRHFENNVKPAGVLEYPGKLKPEARENLKKSWASEYGGAANAGKTILLEEGMKWTQVGMSAEDAQYIQSRKFDVSEIARWFNMPPHMLKDLDRAIQANIEQQSLEFVIYTMMPWYVRWEQALSRALLDDDEKEEFFFEFLVDGLLRGDSVARANALAIKRQNGIINADEWRALDNMNPQPEGQGKTYLVPLNMVPADQIGEVEGTTAGVPTTAQGGEADERATRAANQERSVKGRLRIQRSHRRIFADAAGRIVTREAKAVREAAQKALGRRTVGEMRKWLTEYYEPRGDFRKFVNRTMFAPVASLADMIATEAAGEIGAAVTGAAELEAFVTDYVETLATRYVESSRGQLSSFLKDEDADQALEEIEGRLSEWLEKRPEKIAHQETVQASNAVARETYKAAGVKRMRWQKTGEETCPICDELDGRTVAIEGDFGSAEGVETKHHPPAHQGCDCQLVPA